MNTVKERSSLSRTAEERSSLSSAFQPPDGPHVQQNALIVDMSANPPFVLLLSLNCKYLKVDSLRRSFRKAGRSEGR
eukprot:935665-Pleurochrysis_carterae.AAC.1